MQINSQNLKELINTLNENEVYEVEIKSIVDAGINPREVDVKYAEQMSQYVPPILLGIVKNDEELKDSLIIIDGNHRLYSYMNVHELDYIKAQVKYYDQRGEAIIDAYKLNMYHGKRLSEKDILIGIRKAIEFLKCGNNEKTYKELSDIFDMSKSVVYEYITWSKIIKVLKVDIDKSKAIKLNIFLKDVDNGEENLKLFWELNKNISVRGIRDAIKYYRKTGQIVDWDKYKAQSAIFSDDDDDGLIEEEKKVTKISEINKPIKKEEDINIDDEEYEVEEEFELNDVEEESNPSENILDKDIEVEDEDIDVKEEYTANNFISNNAPINEGRKIETGKMKESKDDSHLISRPGLIRKYSFETVMSNVFEELTEGVISSQNSLNEVLENNLHDNRQMFESKKNEYLRALDNVEYIIKKMRKALEKANKDFKE